MYWRKLSSYYLFQSTRPSRGETWAGFPWIEKLIISIHSPLAGRDPVVMQVPSIKQVISIHSPLAGRDGGEKMKIIKHLVISIHSPLAGRDRSTRNAKLWM